MSIFTSNIPVVINNFTTMKNLSAQNIDLSGNLDVSGLATFTEINANNFSVISGITTISGELRANGGIKCDTNAFVVADTTGNTTIAGTLSVSGLATLSGGITANNFSVADSTGNTTIGGTLGVTSNTTIGNSLGINTSSTLTRLSISPTVLEPKITLWDNGSTTNHYGFGVSANQLNYHSGADHVFYRDGKNGNGTQLLRISTSGNTTIAGTLSVSGLATLSGGITADNFSVADGTGITTITGELRANGGIKCDNDRFVVADNTGNTTIAGTLGVSGTTTVSTLNATNRLMITGSQPTIYFKDNTTGDRSGMIHMNDSRMYFLSGVTNSETWTQVNGQWPLYLQTNTNESFFGGSVTLNTGNLTLSSSTGTINAINGTFTNVTISGPLNANGGIKCDNDRFVVADETGNTTIAGTLSVSGLATLSGGISAENFSVADATGNTTVGNTLFIGNNDNSSTPKTIKFGGTFGDNTYEHSVIETRVYRGTEGSELLLFKGNDTSITSGPDRIRLRAAEINFDTYASATSERTSENIRMTILQNGQVGIGINTPERLFHVRGNNAIWRLDRDAPDPALQLHRFDTNFVGAPLKGFVMGVSAASANNGYFFINDYAQNVTGGSTQRFIIENDGQVTIINKLSVGGGISADNFSVADGTGNTTIGGTLGVTGQTTLQDISCVNFLTNTFRMGNFRYGINIPIISNNISAGAFFIICLNTGGDNECVGRFYFNRSSGHDAAGIVDIVISSRSTGDTPHGFCSYQTIGGPILTPSPINFSIMSGTFSGVSFIGLTYEGGDAFPFSEVYFDGIWKSSGNNLPFDMKLSSQVSNQTLLPMRAPVLSLQNKRIFIDRDGKVGIGTNTPGTNLDVVGTLRSSGLSTFSGGITADNFSVADSTGNTTIGGTLSVTSNTTIGNSLGINTSSTLTRLSISPTVTEPKITLWDGGSTTNHYGFGVSYRQLNYHSGADHVFYCDGKNGNGTQLLRINTSGNTTIAGTLSVSGVATLSGGLTANNRITIAHYAPTINFRDSDHRSAFIHVNSNIMYFLRGENNSTTWNLHCLEIDLNTRTSTFFNGVRVFGVEHTQDFTNAESDWWTNGGQIQADPPNLNFSLYCQYSIRADAYVARSDSRTKCNIKEINQDYAINIIRNMKPSMFNFIDNHRKTTSGFIAQDVKKYLPECVHITRDVVPNILIEASVSRLNNSEYELLLKSTIDISLNIGSKILLKSFIQKELEFTTEVVYHNNNIIIVKSQDKSFYDISRVIIYGEEVNDFLTIDYNYIFTYGISSIKELDRQLQSEKEKTEIIQSKYNTLSSQYNTLSSQYNNLLERIISLESRN